jgi:hypothetical protein
MKRRSRGGKRVVLPVTVLADQDESGAAEVGQVPGRRGLRDAQDAHQISHAHLTVVVKEVEDA